MGMGVFRNGPGRAVQRVKLNEVEEAQGASIATRRHSSESWNLPSSKAAGKKN
jgi:hypothetical protein